MTCKDCVHYEACLDWCRGFEEEPAKCEHFKDKSKFIELPCKVGDKAYVIDNGDYQSNYKPYVREKVVTEISWKYTRAGKDLGFGLILKGGNYDVSSRYNISSIGKSVFFTPEKAEQALKEM